MCVLHMKKMDVNTKIRLELLLANAWFETNENNIFGNIWINGKSVLAQGVRKPLLYSLGTCCHWGTACIWCCMNVGLPAIILARPMTWCFFCFKGKPWAPRRLRDQFWWLRPSKFSLESTQGICQRIRFTRGTETIIRRFQKIQLACIWRLEFGECVLRTEIYHLKTSQIPINKSWFTHGLQTETSKE